MTSGDAADDEKGILLTMRKRQGRIAEVRQAGQQYTVIENDSSWKECVLCDTADG